MADDVPGGRPTAAGIPRDERNHLDQETEVDDATRDRALGAVLGVHAGDSLGATLEFQTAEACRARYPDGLRDIVGGGPFDWVPGDPTDDTDLTWAVAAGYLDRDFEPPVVDAVAARMLAWADTGPRDIGGTTRDALAAYRRTGDPATSGRTDERSQANGSLMRTMPVAVARLDDPVARRTDAAELSAITHAHPVCLAACLAYCDLAAALIHGVPVTDAVAVVAAEAVEPAVRAAVVEAGATPDPVAGPAPTFDDLTGPAGGYVLWALKLAVRALLTSPDVETGLVHVVMLGDDADTNGAIAGGLLGARFGAAALPARWVARLRLADPLGHFAETALAHR